MATTSGINNHLSSPSAHFLQRAAESYAAQVFSIPECQRICAYYSALTTYEALVPAYNPNQLLHVNYIDELTRSFDNINRMTDLEQRNNVLTYWEETVTLYFQDPSINPVECFRNALQPHALLCAAQISASITPQIFEEIATQSIHFFTAQPLSSYLEFQETVKVLALGFIIGVMKPTAPNS